MYWASHLFKLATIESELYCKIVPMCKCCWHWTNHYLVNKQFQIQQNWNNDMFKVSQHTVHAKETKPVTHVLPTWNKSVSGLQTRQETYNQQTINWNNDLFKVGVNVLELIKQDNTNAACVADMEKFIIWLANNTINKITEIMTCPKSNWDHENKMTPMLYADDTGQTIM